MDVRKAAHILEKRIYPRVEVSQPVLYYTGIYHRPKVAQTLELSMGGTRIETPYPLNRGEGLEISIAIHPEVIRCRGEVVHTSWRDGERLTAGVRFEDLSKRDRLYLGGYISFVMEQSESRSVSL